VRATPLKPYGVTGETLDVRGQQSVSFTIGGREFTHEFLVCSLPADAAGLLGADFMDRAGVTIDFGCGKMSLTGIGEAPRADELLPSRRAALTIFPEGKEGHSPQPCFKEARHKDEQFSARLQHEPPPARNRTWLVKAKESISIAPRSHQIVTGWLESSKEQALPPLVCVEPTDVPIEGIFPARVLSRVERNVRRVTSRADWDATGNANSCACLMLTNFSDETLIVPKSTLLGIAEEVSESIVDKINVVTEANSSEPCRPPRKGKSKILYNKLLHGKLDHLSPDDRRHIEPVLVKYAHVFHDEETNDFKGTSVIEHEIHVGDARPIRRPPYRTPFALRGEMDQQIQKMLQQGVIRESSSPWSAPASLVPKKSLDGKPKYRFCVDFRALNAVTKFDPYPLPRVDETVSTLFGSKYFTVLDCASGFWQMNIKEQHKERTGFTVPSGHYEFNRLPFGLSNSPSNFQRLMDTVLRNLVGIECWIYIDDVILFSDTAEEHAQRLENVLRRFDEANLQLHPGKCVFAQSEVHYLGFVLSEKGVSASPDKVEAVQNYPTPRNVRDVRAYLGLASFYRRLVPDFAEIAKPLTQLTRKGQEFTWGPRQQEAFEGLKQKLCNPPVLAYPNFKLPFILTTDASKAAVAAILSQVQDGIERPIAYASRQLNSAEQSYSASECEMLAFLWATKYFRCYLLGTKFLVRTDHSVLTYLQKFADTNSRLLRWSIKLSEFDFVVEHRPGSKIPHVDALSRHVGAVTHDGCPNKTSVLQEQAKDAFCAKQDHGTFTSRKSQNYQTASCSNLEFKITKFKTNVQFHNSREGFFYHKQHDLP
jgi:hypothetical protein